jgi:hypothetical protein
MIIRQKSTCPNCNTFYELRSQIFLGYSHLFQVLDIDWLGFGPLLPFRLTNPDHETHSLRLGCSAALAATRGDRRKAQTVTDCGGAMRQTYKLKKGCLMASLTVIRFSGLNCSMRFSKSRAVGSQRGMYVDQSPGAFFFNPFKYARA